MQMIYRSRASRGRNISTIKRADAEAVQIKGPHREEKGDDKESGCRGYNDQAHAEG